MNKMIQDAVELGATLALERLGMTSGEMSQRQAKKVYGKYFCDLVAYGRIHPAHQDGGHAGTKYYRIADILTCKIEDRQTLLTIK